MTACSSANSFSADWVVGEATPVLQERIQWRLYPLHATSCVISLLLVWFAYPETMGVPLEEMDKLFGEDADSGQDLEAASLLASNARVDPPSASAVKRHAESDQPHPTASTLGDRLKSALGMDSRRKANSGGSTSVGQYATIRTDDE